MFQLFEAAATENIDKSTVLSNVNVLTPSKMYILSD